MVPVWREMSPATLIQTRELSARLDDPSLRVLDATAFLRREIDGGPYVVESGREAYNERHIPGALFADVPGDLSDPDAPFRFTVPSAARFAHGVGALGVGESSRVVVYAQETPMWATRLWWLFRYFGFDNVSVLDGGLRAWSDAGLPVSSELTLVEPEEFHATLRPLLLASKADILQVVEGQPACLVNALPPKAFRGEGPGAYSRPGRIPGSVSHPASELLDESTGRFVERDALRQRLEGPLSVTDRPIIAYCGGGISATVDVFALSLLGRDDVKLYDGSLTEWSADPTLPLVVD
jgi:thiosulfate/3-mercaptopyruvate sulfurtransferase